MDKVSYVSYKGALLSYEEYLEALNREEELPDWLAPYREMRKSLSPDPKTDEEVLESSPEVEQQSAQVQESVGEESGDEGSVFTSGLGEAQDKPEEKPETSTEEGAATQRRRRRK